MSAIWDSEGDAFRRSAPYFATMPAGSFDPSIRIRDYLAPAEWEGLDL